MIAPQHLNTYCRMIQSTDSTQAIMDIIIHSPNARPILTHLVNENHPSLEVFMKNIGFTEFMEFMNCFSLETVFYIRDGVHYSHKDFHIKMNKYTFDRASREYPDVLKKYID